MGSYTSFELDVTLREDTPADVMVGIKRCLDSDHHEALSPTLFTKHKLFKCPRWENMLNHWSAAIEGRCGGVLEGRRLRVISSLKAYDDELKELNARLTDAMLENGKVLVDNGIEIR